MTLAMTPAMTLAVPPAPHRPAARALLRGQLPPARWEDAVACLARYRLISAREAEALDPARGRRPEGEAVSARVVGRLFELVGDAPLPQAFAADPAWRALARRRQLALTSTGAAGLAAAGLALAAPALAPAAIALALAGAGLTLACTRAAEAHADRAIRGVIEAYVALEA